MLEKFKPEIHRLLSEDPRLPGVRVRELLEPLGCTAGKAVVDDYLREVRPLFGWPGMTFQRTVYRPVEVRGMIDASRDQAVREPAGRPKLLNGTGDFTQLQAPAVLEDVAG